MIKRLSDASINDIIRWVDGKLNRRMAAWWAFNAGIVFFFIVSAVLYRFGLQNILCPDKLSWVLRCIQR